jgi:hypothetical protein
MFQSTISSSGHTANPEHILEVAMEILSISASPLLQQDDKRITNITMASIFESCANVPKIILYYLVPSWIFEEFVTRPAEPNEEAKNVCKSKNLKVLAAYWNQIVSIKVLCVDQPKE